jgi:hypothetical protein
VSEVFTGVGKNPGATERLRRETEAARALLADLYPILENDDAMRRDVVEGETNMHDAIRQAIARIVEIRALVEGINATLRILGERGNRLEDQEERIRAAMLTAMEVAGLPKLETPLGTVSRRAVPPSVLVTDEAVIPAAYWNPQPPKLARATLLAALKALRPGEHIPGAELSNGGATIALKLT